MAVWTIARWRATTAGPGLVARTAARVCSPQRRTTSSASEGPYWLKLNVEAGPLGLAGLGGGGSLVPARAENGGLIAAARSMIRLMSRVMRALFVLAMLCSLTDRQDVASQNYLAKCAEHGIYAVSCKDPKLPQQSNLPSSRPPSRVMHS